MLLSGEPGIGKTRLCDELKLGSAALLEPLRGTDGSAEANRARLYELLAGALRERSASGPLLLAFEGLHAADLPSAQLLAFAARTLKRSGIFWLLTSREKDPRLSNELEAVLSKVAREGHRLQPSRLGRNAALGRIEELSPELGRRLPVPSAQARSACSKGCNSGLSCGGTMFHAPSRLRHMNPVDLQ